MSNCDGIAVEVKAGMVFRHRRILDPAWKPGPGQRYADAPKAVCRVTRVVAGTVWYGVGADSTRADFRADVDGFLDEYAGEVLA